MLFDMSAQKFCCLPTFALQLQMLPLIKFRIKNIKGGEATFDKRFFTLLERDIFRLDFCYKMNLLNLKYLNGQFHNIYKCIQISHFLHKENDTFHLDFCYKMNLLDLKRLNGQFRNIDNKIQPFLKLFFCLCLLFSVFSVPRFLQMSVVNRSKRVVLCGRPNIAGNGPRIGDGRDFQH